MIKRFDESISISKQDILPLTYFIISMFQQENTHIHGTSSKSDLIGGYIDRWINKLPENLVFNKILLKNKNYIAINDYFIYGAASDKNAPDILGLRVVKPIKQAVIKFAEFNNDTWEMCEGMPHIEVKTFRENQKLVSVRDTQLDDNTYYVFVESNFAPDYLVSLFSEEVIDISLRNNIFMSYDFIKSNEKNILKQPQEITRLCNNDIGTLKILSIIKGSDYKKNSVLCKEKEDVYYFKSVIEHNDKIPQIKAYEEKISKDKLNMTLREYLEDNNQMWNNKKLINFNIDCPENITIKKVNKESLFIQVDENCNLYGNELKKDKLYKIELGLFERNSKWSEYITLKNQCLDECDKRDELVNLFDKIVEVSKNNEGYSLTPVKVNEMCKWIEEEAKKLK